MRFEFATATRIVFGAGALRDLGPLAVEMGRRALVVVGGSVGRAAPLLDVLKRQKIEFVTFEVEREPTIEIAQRGVQIARDSACDLVIGFGGGSAIDTGKAIAALVTNPGDPLDYLEVIGAGKPLQHAPLPFIALPTTAGTGAEVTRNAVLASPEHRVKVSLRSPLMLPKLALVDPELALSVPPDVTASTGMDALTQVLEPFTSLKANPVTDAFSREGLQRAGRSLRRAYEHGDDLNAREDMALTSLLSGLALANAALGAVHGFAGPLCGMYPVPHGVVCARLLPLVTSANLIALREREPNNPALARYDEAARLLTNDQRAKADDIVEWLDALSHDLAIPGLAAFGVTEADFPQIVASSERASSMKGNPIKLTAEELTAVLDEAL